MRKVVYSAAVSVDGFLAGPDEAMDWLRFSDDAARINASTWVGVDTMLLGRKAYQFAVRSGESTAIRAVKTYVFSRKLDAVEGVELVRDDPVAFLRSLRATQGGHILISGGGKLGTTLVGSGLVDEIALNIHPLILGDGVRMIGRIAERVELELVEGRAIDRGCVFVRYRVRN